MKPLFIPFTCSLRNRFLPGGRPSSRSFIILLFGMLIFGGLYLISLKTIGYFHSQNELGIILSLKIMQMAWVLIFTMLIFSSMISGVSALFLSQDNEILFASPVPTADLFLMRCLTTGVYTSWMMVIFCLPVFGAYGSIFEAGPIYFLLLVPTVIAVAAIAVCLGLTATILLVTLFPARRIKDIVFYLSLLFGILLYLVFRLLRPEELADPERFPDFIAYLSRLSTPASPLLPPGWAANLLTGYLQDHRIDWLLAAILLLTVPVIYFAGEWAITRLFFSGYSKAQESFGGSLRFRPKPYRPSMLGWFFRKELKMFIRDSSQWSQLFLIGALIVVYLYNFKVLPLDQSPMAAEAIANIIAYANIGLTGFLIASLAARFVYPSIGGEGQAFGQILTSPISIGRYICYKYLFYVIPFSILALFLLGASNYLLRITGPMWWVSLITGMIITWSVVALALGFGAVYADFKAENQAAVQGGFGAIMFLFSALSYELLIILIATVPTYRLVRSWRWGLHFSSPILVQTGGAIMLILLSGFLLSKISLTRGMRRIARNFH